MIEWEANNISVSESFGSILLGGSLCASVVNPDINNTNQSVQIQVVSENFTAQGGSSVVTI